MAITIGTFSSSNLKVQPFGYEGEARAGLTATTLEFVGLLRPSEWISFKEVYDTWRNDRIEDSDTLVSKNIGSTVSVSALANEVEWVNVQCWFIDPPSASQVGAFIEVSGKLVDANEALEVLLKQESEVDCDRIRVDLEKKRDETDCEITALSNGLADNFASQNTALEVINRTAELTAKNSTIDTLTDLDYQFEVQQKTAQRSAISDYAEEIAGLDVDIEIALKTGELSAKQSRINSVTELDYQLEVQQKTSQLAKLPDYAEDIAGLDADIEIASRTGELAAKASRADSLAELDYEFEIQQKTAQVNVIESYADTIVGLDTDIEVANSSASITAFDETKKGLIAANKYDLEILDTQVEIDTLSAKMTTLKAIRELKALYDKQLGEDLPDFGNQTLGQATIRLIEPADTRLETPSFSMTVTGNALITGPLKVVRGRNIVGILTSGTIDDVLTWYDTKVVSTPSAGSYFPTSVPEFTVESVLVNGAKGSRVTVQLSVVEIP